MEHENLDENAKYLAACENVKKIVNAIKSIKIKYYPNFAKISEADKKVYDELEFNLEKISEDNNLNRLKTVLMEEVSAKYDKKDMNNNESRDPKFLDNKLLACYGAIDAQQKALSQGKISQARRCQDILKQYMSEIDSIEFKKIIIDYKREKIGELIRDREIIQKRIKETMQYMKSCYESDVSERQHASEQIQEAKNNSTMLFNKARMNTDELVLG